MNGLVSELYREGHRANTQEKNVEEPSTSAQSLPSAQKRQKLQDDHTRMSNDDLQQLEKHSVPEKKCRACSKACPDCAAKEEANG